MSSSVIKTGVCISGCDSKGTDACELKTAGNDCAAKADQEGVCMVTSDDKRCK